MDRFSLYLQKRVGDRFLALPECLENHVISNTLNYLEAVAKEGDADGKKPLWLVCDTLGGQMRYMMRLVQSMQEVSFPIITVASKQVASAGIFVFAAGDLRLVSENAEFKFHAPIPESADQHWVEQDRDWITKYSQNNLAMMTGGEAWNDPRYWQEEFVTVEAPATLQGGLADHSFTTLDEVMGLVPSSLTKRVVGPVFY